MRIGIIGAGSIGLLIASYLTSHHDITLYVRRKSQKKQIEENGISLYDNGDFIRSEQIMVKTISEMGMEDYYIVCVKQTSMEALLPTLQAINPVTPLLFLQNGMGHLPLIDTLLQPMSVGIIEHGAKRMNDVSVNHLGKGIIKLAPYTQSEAMTKQFIEVIHQEVFPIVYATNYKAMLQDKLMVNAVINPLTALFDVKNGDIIDNPEIKKLAIQLTKEYASILHMESEKAWAKIKQISIATKGNTSSMLADIQSGRKTEVDAILGYIIQHTDEEAPYTMFLYQCILALEKRGENN